MIVACCAGAGRGYHSIVLMNELYNLIDMETGFGSLNSRIWKVDWLQRSILGWCLRM